ncbi:hypothetical protein C9374_005547 [Naegleria lovaniensis]|uniref:RapZ C-terminal domain-containing protein n=1 Tax=Naegleria lovaniensis TaxID=51637 RepID=A0AA88GLC4_NAELO|nr:uncharacterized protein C9374_005547 [Naegleria lovaniensis]KAG2382345.1 hypothetical protein C9374_005547 [Naegleria lovaniensis]
MSSKNSLSPSTPVHDETEIRQEEMMNHHRSSASPPSHSISIRIITFGLLHGKISKSSYQLIYNLQDLPNPLTAQARKKMTGLNKPLRKDFFANELVQTFFDNSHKEIVSELKKFHASCLQMQNNQQSIEDSVNELVQSNLKGIIDINKDEETSVVENPSSLQQESSSNTETKPEKNAEDNENDDDDAESEEESEEDDELEDILNEGEDEYIFTIAVYCHKGKHRSVSFAEELKEQLASDPDLRNLISQINVTHRDVHKSNSNKSSNDKNTRRNQKSSFSYFNE